MIRREFRQFESSWYDADKIKLSRDRVDRLGYFKDVNVETPDVPGTPDQVDLNVDGRPKSRPATCSSAPASRRPRSSRFTASVKQENVFGTGNYLGVEVNTSKYNRTIAFSHDQPVLHDDGISRAFDLYHRTSRPPAMNSGEYTLRQTGGHVPSACRSPKSDTVFFGAGARAHRRSRPTDQLADAYKHFVIQNGGPASGWQRRTNSIPLTVAWARDTRDSAVTPTRGRYQRVNLELDPIGDAKYYRAIYDQQWYRPITRWMTLAPERRTRLRRGHRRPRLPGLQELLRRRHRLGARLRELVAGYRRPVHLRRPGRRQARDRQRRAAVPVPGQRRRPHAALVRLRRRRPGLPGERADPTSQLRYSAGIGLSWISPVGPLKLSYAKPLNAKPGDRLERFQFQMGTGF